MYKLLTDLIHRKYQTARFQREVISHYMRTVLYFIVDSCMRPVKLERTWTRSSLKTLILSTAEWRPWHWRRLSTVRSLSRWDWRRTRSAFTRNYLYFTVTITAMWDNDRPTKGVMATGASILTLRHWNFREDCNKFGQLILRKIIKTVATRCDILTLKCANPLGELTALPRPLS